MSIIWVFNGVKSKFPSGVFENLESAENWIKKHSLHGILTKYYVGIGAYDWAIDSGEFVPRKDEHKSPEFIGNFSSAAMEHYHYENGLRD